MMGRMMIDSSGSQPFTITGAPVAVSELKTIVLAQRAISAQIEVNKLIETLLVVALKHVSAERGLLFLAYKNAPQIVAEAIMQTGTIHVVFSPAFVTSPRFPDTVLRYVIRMEESVLLEDAATENPFSEDDYVRISRSLLCLPLITQRELIGVLYLESSSVPGAFTTEHLAGLELLGSQAAAVLKCAFLASELDQSRKRQSPL